MDTHTKKLLRRVLIILIILIVVFYLLHTYILGKPITSFYSNNADKITKIDVMSGNTGNITSITSKEEIKTITDCLDSVTLKRIFPPASGGWLYKITVYSDDKKLITLTDIGSMYEINDRKYKVTYSNGSCLYEVLNTLSNIE